MRLKTPFQCRCKECGADFVRYRDRGDFTWCTPCQKKNRLAKWYAENPDRRKELRAAWFAANPEATMASKRKWSAANKGLEAAKQARRRAKKLKATPSWANHGVTKDLYTLAKIWSDAMGEAYHVDHIVPLQGKEVCGLHWHGNLQILPGKANQSKSNKMTYST